MRFTQGPLCGGFYRAEGYRVAARCPLLVLTAYDLAAVEAAGGGTSPPAFDFAGGRRFHFTDPISNKPAVCVYA